MSNRFSLIQSAGRPALIISRRQFTGGLTLGSLLLATMRPAAAATDLDRQFATIERTTGGRLGIAALDSASGRQWQHRADERFPMCSTFKLLACAALLARVDRGQEDIGRRLRFTPADLVPYSPVTEHQTGGEGMRLGDLCAAAMTHSDNTAANLILGVLGGPAEVTRFARDLGDPLTRMDRLEPILNRGQPGDPRDTTTPAAMLGNLHRLLTTEVLAQPSRERLSGWLRANTTGDARLRAGLPSSWTVGDKTGSGDHGTANDVAVAWPPGRQPLYLAVYLTGSTIGPDQRSAAIAKVGRLIAGVL